MQVLEWTAWAREAQLLKQTGPGGQSSEQGGARRGAASRPLRHSQRNPEDPEWNSVGTAGAPCPRAPSPRAEQNRSAARPNSTHKTVSRNEREVKTPADVHVHGGENCPRRERAGLGENEGRTPGAEMDGDRHAESVKQTVTPGRRTWDVLSPRGQAQTEDTL